MKNFVLLFTALIYASNVFAGDNDFFVVAKGDKEKVLSVLQKAMQAEFSNGVFEPYIGRVGYKLYYQSFMSGNTEFGVGLVPLADGDDLIPTAYKLDIYYRAQKGGQS